MSRGYIRERKLSIFTYFFILSCVILSTVFVFKELGLTESLEEILYQKDISGDITRK